MDNIWKNAAKKQRARDLCNTTVKTTPAIPALTTDTTTLHQKPVTTTTTPKWCNPETVTLEQIDKNTRRLLWEWPKDNGTPFPIEILEVLRDLKLRVRARDVEKMCSATVSEATNTDTAAAICTPAPAYLVVIDSNTPAPDPRDSFATTTNNTTYPTTATADLW